MSAHLPRPPAALVAARLPEVPAGARVAVAGLVILRQRPGTAGGVVFLTLEDETGVINVIVWRTMFARYRRAALAGDGPGGAAGGGDACGGRADRGYLGPARPSGRRRGRAASPARSNRLGSSPTAPIRTHTPPMPRPAFPAAALILVLAACQPVPGASVPPPGLAERPPGAPPGTCWGRQVSPAVIETITEQVQTAPAVTGPDGRIVTPARYATETRQAIVEARRVRWIETPCPDDLPPDFTASLQRALMARGLHDGPVTGRIDGRTRAAIRAYQAARGLDSDILSLESARALGLVALPRPE